MSGGHQTVTFFCTVNSGNGNSQSEYSHELRFTDVGSPGLND